MFKETIYATKLKSKLKDCLDQIKVAGDAIQIVHRVKDEPIRVLITQDHYLNLLQKVAQYESQLNLRERGSKKQRPSREKSIERLTKRNEKIASDMKNYGESIE